MCNYRAIILVISFFIHFNALAGSWGSSALTKGSFTQGFFVGAGIYALGQVACQQYRKVKNTLPFKRDRGTLEAIEAIVGRIITSLGLVNFDDLRGELEKLQKKLENHIREHHQTLDEDDIKTLVTAAFQMHMEANFVVYENVIKGIAHDVVDDMVESLERRIDALEKRKNELDAQVNYASE